MTFKEIIHSIKDNSMALIGFVAILTSLIGNKRGVISMAILFILIVLGEKGMLGCHEEKIPEEIEEPAKNLIPMKSVEKENKKIYFNNIKENIVKVKKSENHVPSEPEKIPVKLEKFVDYDDNPYHTNLKNIHNQYHGSNTNNQFELKLNPALSSTPLFNLRTVKGCDFYWNFIIHNFDTKKINNLIMCKEIYKWMSEKTSLSEEDLNDDFCPIYFIAKNDVSDVTTYEYLRIFIHTNHEGIKTAFVQKGLDYMKIEKLIRELIEKKYIRDLLNQKEFFSYNLTLQEDISDFLDNLLSLTLPPEVCIGESITLDIKNFCENKVTYDYLFHSLNSSDLDVFNTSL